MAAGHTRNIQRKGLFMKLLHTSDWHLGATDSGRYLLEDQSCFIDEICGIIRDEDVDAVLIAGDVYDRSVASADAIRLYDRAVTRMCMDMGVPVIVIAGNHDGAERLESCSELLAAANLHVCGSLQRGARRVSLEDADVYMLPWITEEKVKSVCPERKEEIASLEDAYSAAVDEMTKDFDPAKKHILLAHAFITDAETSTSDKAAVIGTATQVPARIFEGFDYVALGHIHKPQDVNERIRYSGTPMAYSFGKEEKQEKSVTILDTETMEKKVVPLHPLHRRTTLEGTLEELLAADFEEEVVNGYVKLKVTDKPVGLASLTQLRAVYPNLFECESRSFDSDSSSIKMTIEEYEELQTDPAKVFESFCREMCSMEPDAHLMQLFENAVMMTEEAEQ